MRCLRLLTHLAFSFWPVDQEFREQKTVTLQTKKAFQLHFATTRISKFVSFLYKFVLLQSVFLSIPLLLFFSRFRTLHRPETIAFYFGCSSLEIMIKKNHEPRARPSFSNKQLANFWHYLDKILHAVRGYMKNKNALKKACAFYTIPNGISKRFFLSVVKISNLSPVLYSYKS